MVVFGPGLHVPLPSCVQYGGGYVFPYFGPDSLRDPVAMGLHGADTRARNRLILVSAGECVDDVQGCIAGQRDSHLTQRGRQQAFALGKAIRSAIAEGGGVGGIFCSKMKRAKETCEIICEAAGLDFGGINDDLEIRTAAALNERNWGFLEGRLASRAQEEYGQELYQLYRESIRIAPPGGESLGAIMHIRVAPYLDKAILPSISGLRSRTAIIVAHPDSLRAIQLLLNGQRNPAAICQGYIAPGQARFVTVDKKGGFLKAADIAVPGVDSTSLPAPVAESHAAHRESYAPHHDSSLESQSTEASSVLNTPPDDVHVLPWSAMASNEKRDNVKVVDSDSKPISDKQPLHEFPRDVKQKTQIKLVVVKGKGKAIFEDDPFFDAPQSPLVSKPLNGSRFVEQLAQSNDERINIPGRRVAFMLDTPDVAAASAHHGGQPLASVIRIAA